MIIDISMHLGTNVAFIRPLNSLFQKLVICRIGTLSMIAVLTEATAFKNNSAQKISGNASSTYLALFKRTFKRSRNSNNLLPACNKGLPDKALALSAFFVNPSHSSLTMCAFGIAAVF